MEVLDAQHGHLDLRVTTNEALLLTNALNEVCNGIHIDDREFSTRLGIDREGHALSCDRSTPPSTTGHRRPNTFR